MVRFQQVEYTFFTSPSPGIPSINSPSDAARSAEICFPSLVPLVPHHDAFLVACYSAHPLVGLLKGECARLTAAATKGAEGSGARKYVTGIFEASCLASLGLVGNGERSDRRERSEQGEPSDQEERLDQEEHLDQRGQQSNTGAPSSNDSYTYGFGIVSTGKIWEFALHIAVQEFLGATSSSTSQTTPSLQRFYGCETTGLNASELHDLPAEQVREKMMDATKRLLRRGAIPIPKSTDVSATEASNAISSRVQAICLGCAGMVGLDAAVRSACIEELGPEAGKEVHIVDGVKAGVGILYSLARCGF